MGKRESYAPGTFCWVDLATTDQDAAKEFYGGLFGWVAEDMPVGDGISYSMMRRDGANVAAIAPQPTAQREAGVPPLWQSYVSVASADAACERVAASGGTVHAPAFDVMEAGRMAVLQDPQGGFFMVWEPGRHFGAALVNAPGALCWNELSTTDVGGAAAFYAAVFGWTTTAVESMPDYVVINNGETSNGGIRPVSPPGLPSHWMAYFGIEDIEAGLARVTELGGSVHAGPIDIGIARIGIASDPQGAAFALYAGSYDD
ncbi:MAG: VOC family protein [Actinobacteria bacterium]|nr:VOC family protein [Actinomycetota bacterium]